MCNALPLTRCDRFNGVINAHARGFVPSNVGDPLLLRLAPRSIHPAVDTRIRATDVTQRFATISGGGFFSYFSARERIVNCLAARDIALLPAICVN